jgi:hypothetical protein
VTVAERLEALGRLVPGVAGYLDRERSRDTDKAVRDRLAAGLAGVKRDLEHDQRTLAEARALADLPALDRLASVLDRLARAVAHAARGYRGLFDQDRISEARLARLYDFDLGLFTELESVRAAARAVREALGDRSQLGRAMAAMQQTLDRFERLFSRRDALAADGEGAR